MAAERWATTILLYLSIPEPNAHGTVEKVVIKI